MPTGSNPNSRKALEQHRQKTQFSGEIAVKMQKKSAESRKLNSSLKGGLRELMTDDIVLAMCDKLIQRALSGNLKAFKEIRETLDENGSEQNNGAQVNLAILADVLPREEPPDE